MTNKPDYPQFVTCEICKIGIAQSTTIVKITNDRYNVNYFCTNCKIKSTRMYFKS